MLTTTWKMLVFNGTFLSTRAWGLGWEIWMDGDYTIYILSTDAYQNDICGVKEGNGKDPVGVEVKRLHTLMWANWRGSLTKPTQLRCLHVRVFLEQESNQDTVNFI